MVMGKNVVFLLLTELRCFTSDQDTDEIYCFHRRQGASIHEVCSWLGSVHPRLKSEWIKHYCNCERLSQLEN